MIAQDINDDSYEVIWRHILGADLNDAWSFCVRQGEQRAEIEIVRKHDVSIFPSPVHDGAVERSGVANFGSVDGLCAISVKRFTPRRRKIHVDQQFHGRLIGTSISSARQAAYARAS